MNPEVKITSSEAKSLGLGPVTRSQAVGEFSRLSEQRQIEISVLE